MKIISPLAVYLPRKTMKDKKKILNFNVVGGMHFIVYNDMKQIYTELMGDQIVALPCMNKISLVFKYFKGSKMKCDRANIYSIHEKFFCDSLVFYGVLPDDSDEYILETRCLPVEYDKDNPRVEIDITQVFDSPEYKMSGLLFKEWRPRSLQMRNALLTNIHT